MVESPYRSGFYKQRTEWGRSPSTLGVMTDPIANKPRVDLVNEKVSARRGDLSSHKPK